MSSLELKVPPVAVVILIGAAMVLAARIAPGLALAIPLRPTLAAVLLALGVAIALAGVLAFRSHRTTVNPLTPAAATSVVRTGIYRLSRNPMYLGMLLALCALAVYLANGLAALLLPAFVAYMTRFQIRPEERALTEKFGAAYAQYMTTTRRWL